MCRQTTLIWVWFLHVNTVVHFQPTLVHTLLVSHNFCCKTTNSFWMLKCTCNIWRIGTFYWDKLRLPAESQEASLCILWINGQVIHEVLLHHGGDREQPNPDEQIHRAYGQQMVTHPPPTDLLQTGHDPSDPTIVCDLSVAHEPTVVLVHTEAQAPRCESETMDVAVVTWCIRLKCSWVHMDTMPQQTLNHLRVLVLKGLKENSVGPYKTYLSSCIDEQIQTLQAFTAVNRSVVMTVRPVHIGSHLYQILCF